MGRRKDQIGNKSQYSWNKAAWIEKLNNASPNMKLNYSSLAKKINLLNNKGIYDLQYKGYQFTHPLLTQISYRGNKISFTR